MDTAIVPVTPGSPRPISPTDNDGPPSSEIQPNKRRRKKSIVWDHFTVETVNDGCVRATCNQCKKSFAYITGSKLAGTSHLKRHIALGICPVSRQKNQQTPILKTGSATDQPRKRQRASPGYAGIPFDQETCNQEIAKMIIMHKYPLNIVEHSGFVDFVQSLQPQFKMASFNTVQGDCVAMYLREKQSLLNFISGIPGRVSLTLDLWTSDQTVGYVFVTGHFIDADWNLHRRVLNVVTIPHPDSDSAFNQAVVSCISDWHLDGKLFTLTLDHSISNETLYGNVRALLSVKNPHMFHGQLLLGNCFARVISHLAQDTLGTMRETVKKIRESVKYVKTSDVHEEQFFELRQRLQVPSTKELLLDDQFKWDTTFQMLVAACELKEVFACLETSDPHYRIAPTVDDWKEAEILCSYLKLFYDAASILTAPMYPTASVFYHEVSKLQIDLSNATMIQDPFINNLTKPLKEKFDKYWNSCFLALAVGVIMDPRFKMKLIEFSFSKIYGENSGLWIKVVDDGLHELFLEYMVQGLPAPESYMGEGNEGVIPKSETPEAGHFQEEHPEDLASQDPLITIGDGLSDFEVYISEISGGQEMKSELDQYLEESLLPRIQNFEVLAWWKLNKTKYPTLSRMASDILSIPFSTVSSDSVFDTDKKKMDSYWSSLRPVTLEALLCAKDWLQYGATTSENPNAIVKMEL